MTFYINVTQKDGKRETVDHRERAVDAFVLRQRYKERLNCKSIWVEPVPIKGYNGIPLEEILRGEKPRKSQRL